MADAQSNPLDTQVGGGHYKNKAIQPIEYITANNLNFCEGSIVKYITRWADKGGVQDLLKIKHYVDLLIKLDPRAKPAAGVSEAERTELNALSFKLGLTADPEHIRYEFSPKPFLKASPPIVAPLPPQAERV